MVSHIRHVAQEPNAVNMAYAIAKFGPLHKPNVHCSLNGCEMSHNCVMKTVGVLILYNNTREPKTKGGLVVSQSHRALRTFVRQNWPNNSGDGPNFDEQNMDSRRQLPKVPRNIEDLRIIGHGYFDRPKGEEEPLVVVDALPIRTSAFGGSHGNFRPFWPDKPNLGLASGQIW